MTLMVFVDEIRYTGRQTVLRIRSVERSWRVPCWTFPIMPSTEVTVVRIVGSVFQDSARNWLSLACAQKSPAILLFWNSKDLWYWGGRWTGNSSFYPCPRSSPGCDTRTTAEALEKNWFILSFHSWPVHFPFLNRGAYSRLERERARQNGMISVNGPTGDVLG